MKVRFTSPKEQSPTVDGGLKVTYAPGKRMAYRLRWYLILLLVASPFLWFLFQLASGLALLDMPARTVQPVQDVRALESGVVTQLHVVPGQQVSAGSRLVTLDNPALVSQRQAADVSARVQSTSGSPLQRQRNALQQQIDRAQTRVAELARLVSIGAATRGELQQAEDLLNDREAALAALERSSEPSTEQQIELQRAVHELAAVEKRLQQLEINALVDARVQGVEVSEGDSVGPGTLLVQLSRADTTEIYVFLDARYREFAFPGQSLRLRLPDNQWLDARVVESVQQVSRLPPEIRSPFGGNDLGLLVKVQTVEPLPGHWQLDNLPLTARFPNLFDRWWQGLSRFWSS